MDLGKILGADQAASIEKFSIYLPDRDRDNKKVPDIATWIETAIIKMAEVNGGVTRLPPSTGAWRRDDGVLVRENTTVLYSYIRDPALFEKQLPVLVRLLHTFGKRTNQGEVMVEFSGGEPGRYVSRAYFIRKYTQAA